MTKIRAAAATLLASTAFTLTYASGPTDDAIHVTNNTSGPVLADGSAFEWPLSLASA